jgi:serine/arginine repetitive matrix protein 1
MKGTSSLQAPHYADKMKKLLKTEKFPKNLKPLNVSKINLDVIKPWITEKITKILGFDDEVLVEFIVSLLEASTDPKDIFIQVKGFLAADTFIFMQELWDLLASAEISLGGIPQSFLDAKKAELKVKRVLAIYLG